jgi:protein AbiQ
MKYRRLTDDAYKKIVLLEETLEKRERGYGIVEIVVNDLTFAVPFRSNMTHKHGFRTVFHNGQWNGLDYSKAVIIEESDLEKEAFKFRRNDEYTKVKNNKEKINKNFKKYVNGYIAYMENPNDSRLSFRVFGFTTLVNYHAELQIKLPS